ncbi:hypothetical protein QYF36_019191 [Acer negundo]|nr:hypothetical protein QYF36_019191 [Acer negundo]
MGSEEIERLCASMSLKEQEGPVRKLQDELKVCGLLGHTVRGCPEVEEGGIVADQSEGQPESKGAVASDSVYRGDHHSLSAHSDSQNIQWGVSRLKIEETPQKEAEGSATKNLYLHKEELTHMQEESPQLLKHLNDKKLEYQPKSKRPDLIPNSVEAEGSHKKNLEIKDVVASDSVYGGYQYSLSAHFYSLNIQQGVGGIKNAETPQKQAEGSATKNLYLHKEKVTYMQEESPQQLKVGTKGQTSEEKGSKISTCIGDSGHSVQEAGFKLDLCPPKKGSPFMLKPPLLVKSRQKRNEVERALEGQIGNVVRPRMVLLKNILSFSDQDRDETQESLNKVYLSSPFQLAKLQSFYMVMRGMWTRQLSYPPKHHSTCPDGRNKFLPWPSESDFQAVLKTLAYAWSCFD